MTHRSVTALLGLCLVLSYPAATIGRQTPVPRPADVLGFTPGDDYKLADFGQIREYFHRLTASR